MTQPTLLEAIAEVSQWMYWTKDDAPDLDISDKEGYFDELIELMPNINSVIQAARAYEAIQSQVDVRQLEIALKNAVKPNYSEECGEWVLFCGGKESSEAILQAARLIAGRM